MATEQEIQTAVKDILELKITIPLSNETKKLHTRQFIKTNITLPTLRKLASLNRAYDLDTLNTYKASTWNINKIDIKVNNNNNEMTLTLTPYSTDISSEVQALSGFTENSTGKKKIDNDDTELQGSSYLKKVVSTAIKGKKDLLSQAKACHEYFKKKHKYQYYFDFQHGKNFEKTWRDGSLNCGDGAICICHMFNCLGLSPEMRLGHGHYWVVVDIKGKTYYCDQSGLEGHSTTRVLSTSPGDKSVWGGQGNTGKVVSWK